MRCLKFRSLSVVTTVALKMRGLSQSQRNIRKVIIRVLTVAYNLLAWIICKDDEREEQEVNGNENCQRLVQSLVKTLTGSKEVITLLSRDGHGISYAQVLVKSQMGPQEHSVIFPFVIFVYICANVFAGTTLTRSKRHYLEEG